MLFNCFRHQLTTRRRLDLSLLTGLILATAWLPSTAHALDIVLVEPGADPEFGTRHMDIPQWLAVEAAAEMWERAFRDDITVTVAIRVREASGGLRAETHSSLVTHTVEDVRSALIADADFQFERDIDEQIPDPLPINDDPPRNSLEITMPAANAKALGLSIGRDPTISNPIVSEGLDALVTITTPSHENFLDHYDLDPSDGIDTGKADFVGVVAHELGHALGFVSMVDPAQADRESDFIDLPHHPRTLDIWRFTEFPATQAHSIATETRQTLQGPAELFDGEPARKVHFSRGVSSLSPPVDPVCENVTGCQASHWRANAQDTEPLLMTPTVLFGEVQRARSADFRALDIIGYNRSLGELLDRLRRQRFDLLLRGIRFFPPGSGGDLREAYDEYFVGLPHPPPPDKVRPLPKEPDYWLLGQLHADIDGLRKRSFAGLARFEAESDNPSFFEYDLSEKIPTPADQWEELPITLTTMKRIPPRLTGLYLESDRSGGPKIAFRGQIPRGGIQFNRSLGRYGGFRIGGFLDADGDKAEGDVDAAMTIELLAMEPVDPNKTLEGLAWSTDTRAPGNSLRIVDYPAFGLAFPDLDRDGVEDGLDNCPNVANKNEADRDLDGVGGKCSDPGPAR